jgi:hypothetical protein
MGQANKQKKQVVFFSPLQFRKEKIRPKLKASCLTKNNKYNCRIITVLKILNTVPSACGSMGKFKIAVQTWRSKKKIMLKICQRIIRVLLPIIGAYF